MFTSSRINGEPFYTGQTNNIRRRIFLHKVRFYRRSFTAKYNCDHLMYYEEVGSRKEALKREKVIKKFKRDWKFQMITKMNPGWRDLSKGWDLKGWENYFKGSVHLHRR